MLIQIPIKIFNSSCRCFNSKQKRQKKILMESNLKSRKLNKLALKILNNKFKNFKAILNLKSNKMFRTLSVCLKYSMS